MARRCRPQASRAPETPRSVAQRYLRAMLLLQEWRNTTELARLLGMNRGRVAGLLEDLVHLGYPVERRVWSGMYVYRATDAATVWEKLILPAA